MRTIIRYWLALLMFLPMSPVVASDSMWLTGAEGGPNNSYAYLGYMAPFNLQTADTYYYRYWVDWVDYRYDSDDDIEAHASAPGLEVSVGRMLVQSEQRQVTLFMGLTYRDTKITPDSVDSKVKGKHLGVKLQVEMAEQVDAYRLEGIVSYIAGVGTLWSRGRMWLPPHDKRRQQYGTELVLQGDDEYFAAQLGVLMRMSGRGALSNWMIKGGIRHVDAQGDYGYIGVEALIAQ